MVYFTAIGNIFWIFGIFCGHFVIFFLALGIFYQKYLATLIQRPSHVQGVASHPGLQGGGHKKNNWKNGEERHKGNS
jgi:hypothetical protein